MPTCLFVYGTLSRDGSAHELLPKHAARFIGTGLVFGRLFDLGQYPALVLHHKSSDQVHGEVYELLDESVLEELDAYEDFRAGDQGSLFVRVEARIIGMIKGTNGNEIRPMTAWVYVYNPERSLRGATPIKSKLLMPWD